jgi:GTP diphosphokinase / guanosine-3',5'-bis(diphosphate) 3'-diphosphatase
MPDSELKIRSRDFNTLTESILSARPGADMSLIEKAYAYAEEKHRGQKRLSGEPYIIHPLEVAIILAHLNMDTTAITAALLHDVVEDTPATLDDIKVLFSKDVALLVDGVTKISSLRKHSKSHDQAETLRKMLMATINDPRVIVIKLADKIHNMRTLMFQPPHKQILMADEVLEIYAPLAGRLGMSKVRAELEDLAFKIIHPEEYKMIKTRLAERQDETEKYLDEIRKTLKVKFDEMTIDAAITGRVKHYFSIFRKMQNQQKTFDEIFDIRAVRIITNEVRDCYGILGVVHTLWSPVTSRFKDYIAVPKSNMYQSLHTTVTGPGKHFLEIQIRTKEMNLTAEMGIAAHWAYKEKGGSIKKEISLLNDINRWREELKNTKDFISDLKMELYQDEVFVFTPKGKIIKLAKGATPIDFAFAIHTEVGFKCVGARINGKLSPLKSEISSGDIVEILTSPKGHPSETWLKIVKSSNARQRIRAWIRRHSADKQDQPESETKAEKDRHEKRNVHHQAHETIKIRHAGKIRGTGVVVEGNANVMIRLSQCCQPIPGDPIIGFVTRGRGITVHRIGCPSLKRLMNEPERLISIVWSDTHETTYPVKLAVHSEDREGLLKDIADSLAEIKTNVLKMEAEVNPDGTAVFKFVIEVKGVEHIAEITTHLKKIKNVTHVHKVNEKVT